MSKTDAKHWLARERFKVGDRVELTDDGFNQGLGGNGGQRPVFGTVVGFGARRNRLHIVYVRRDGKKGNEGYHMDFWMPTVSE